MLKGRLGLDTARIPHADRHGLLWLARGNLYVEDGTLRFKTAGGGDLDPGDYAIPFQLLTNLLLGPGSSVTHDAMRLLDDCKAFGVVSDILPLLDSTAKITVPDGMWERLVTGESWPMPVPSTLGVETARILAGLTHPLRDRRSPTEKDGREAWDKWWKELLATDPFPKVPVTVGPLREIASLPMHWPEVRISPDGMSGLLAMGGLRTPTAEARNGLRFVSFARADAARWVYEIPPKEVNRKPTGTVGAWATGRIGAMWHEYEHDPKNHKVLLLSMDRSGKPLHEVRQVGLAGAHHLAICPRGEGWLAACTTRKGAVLARAIAADGGPEGPCREVVANVGTELGWNTGVHAVSMVPTPEGGAALVVGGDRSAQLLSIGGDLSLRGRVRVDDPNVARGHGFKPRMCSSGGVLCVAWAQMDNEDDRLFVRLFEERGRPLTPPIFVAEFVHAIARPMPDGDGFVLVWRSYAQTPGQVRAARVGPKGAIGPTVTVYDGRVTSPNVSAGLSGGRLNVLVHDWSRHPFRLLLKEAHSPGAR